MAILLKPPSPLTFGPEKKVLFLAGTIDMGKSYNWQAEIGNKLDNLDIVILNPRRDGWDSSWDQHIDNPVFREQVDWEMDSLQRANCIFFYFAPGSRSPITLLELGLHAASGKCLVCCPDGFWRKGNVDIVCDRYKIRQVPDLEKAVETITAMLK